jgi:hypothetical protein
LPQEGVDCDEVYPGVFLGNGATLKRKDFLRKIGVTHILNAAEHRGVNIDKFFFDDEFTYKGLRVEDTPQTQICRLSLVQFHLSKLVCMQLGKFSVHMLNSFVPNHLSSCRKKYINVDICNIWPYLYKQSSRKTTLI